MSPPPHESMRGRTNELHAAIRSHGLWRRAEDLISSGLVDINETDSTGATPLIYSAWYGSARLIRMLLERGADLAAVDDDGFNALHASAMRGDRELAVLLLDGGADVQTVEHVSGTSPLHIAAQHGHGEVVDVLVRAGPSVNQQAVNGETPLYMAASRGEARAVAVLLGAKADPLLSCAGYTPLEVAVKLEFPDVVHELLHQAGIGACGGDSKGQRALVCAAQQKELHILRLLSEGGVVDTRGQALCAAVSGGLEQSVKFLLETRVPRYKVAVDAHPSVLGYFREPGDLEVYVNVARDSNNFSAIQCCFKECSLRPFSCRIMRALFDAGVDVGVLLAKEDVVSFTESFIGEIQGHAESDPMCEKTLGLRGILHLLLQVEAIDAESWRWCAASSAAAPTPTAFAPTAASSKQLRRMQPILMQRAIRPRILLAALFRQSHKLDGPFLGYDSEAREENESEALK